MTKKGMSCEFNGSQAALIDTKGRVVATSPALKNSIWDRLHYEGDSITPPTSLTLGATEYQYDLEARRLKQEAFLVDVRSAADGICNVQLKNGDEFRNVPMKRIPADSTPGVPKI